MAGNIFADGMNAFNATNDAIQGIEKRRADYQAAPKIAVGDFSGAAQAYGAAGFAPEARQGVVDQQVMTDRATASSDKAKQEAALEAQRKADGLLHVVDAVQAAPAGQRLARLQALAPVMHNLGVDPGQLGAAKEEDLSDANLASFKALVGKAVQDYSLGGLRYSGVTNKRIAGTITLKDGETVLEPDDPNAPPAPTAAPQPQSPAPTPQPAPAASQGSPRGLRNNNPLNITGQGWDGQTGSDGKFAQFSSLDQGFRAADKNLQAYGTRHGINTLAGVINRWAPASDNNDTQGYIQKVAGDVGLDPNAPINLADPKIRSVILHSMAKVETGMANPLASAAPVAPQAAGPAAVAPPAAPAAPAGFHVLASQPKPVQWQSDGKGNLINTVTGDRKLDPTAAADVTADPNVVKMILRGDYPVPTGRAATSPQWLAAVQEAAAQDPTFSAANYATRVATRKSFTSGKDADQIKSLNTAIGHAATMLSSIDAMRDTPVPALNMFKNAVEGAAGQDIAAKPYSINKDALMHEGLRLFSGAAGGLTEFKGLADQLNYNDNPNTQKAVLQKLVGLFGSRMDALAEKYHGGMGLQADGIEFLSPKAQKAMAKLTGVAIPDRHDIGATGGFQGPSGATPAVSAKSGWSIKPVG